MPVIRVDCPALLALVLIRGAKCSAVTTRYREDRRVRIVRANAAFALRKLRGAGEGCCTLRAHFIHWLTGCIRACAKVARLRLALRDLRGAGGGRGALRARVAPFALVKVARLRLALRELRGANWRRGMNYARNDLTARVAESSLGLAVRERGGALWGWLCIGRVRCYLTACIEESSLGLASRARGGKPSRGGDGLVSAGQTRTEVARERIEVS